MGDQGWCGKNVRNRLRSNAFPGSQVGFATGDYDGIGWLFRLGRQDLHSPLAELNDETDGHRSAKLARLEAALFVADGALSSRRLTQSATLADTAEAHTLIESLNALYDQAGTAFRIERVATGYQMLTRPQYSEWLNRLHQRKAELKLSAPAMETLTIVAYRQPITRADVEAIRGVQCADVLKQLMERRLVRIGGEDDSLGRPYLYETSRNFLELFGLRNLNDLPMADQLRRVAEQAPQEPEAEPAAGSSQDVTSKESETDKTAA